MPRAVSNETNKLMCEASVSDYKEIVQMSSCQQNVTINEDCDGEHRLCDLRCLGYVVKIVRQIHP